MLAYLVIREGSKWTDVFRLVTGRTVTIGRAPTNQIVVKDERCSRFHAEVFMTDGQWTLRDLDSRNGTMVGSERVYGDRPLLPGDIVRVAQAQMAFVHDLSEAFPENAAPKVPFDDETVTGNVGDSNVLEGPEPTTITHRRGQTRFLAPAREDDPDIPKVGRAAKKLCRLAFELASQTDVKKVAKMAIQGVFESVNADAGAVLLLSGGSAKQSSRKQTPEGTDLEVVASINETTSSRYHRVSSFLASMVMREGEAVIARNVEDDSRLGSRDSQGEIHTTGVVCAPIRQQGKVVGVIHLYSTSSEKQPDADDLEFALAVADIVALALMNISTQQELKENLTQTKDEVQQLRKQLRVSSEIIGSSETMLRVQQEISRAAPSRATVLIRGESGVGKELVARAIHYSSPRKKGPFVCLNCAALSETLLESELFGHEKGAFTGATERKIGKFEASDKGTLMLDEIGEMSPTIQAKFLRVLEGHPFERVGGASSIKVDVRVIAATNRDLERAVQDKTFRRDLYFRLRVVELIVPPLRKRTDDIIELADHFLDIYNNETGRRITGYSQEALEHLVRYRWPGNVRELRNVVERAVVLARGEQIGADDLVLSNLETASDSAEMPVAIEGQGYEPVSLAEMERRHIMATLREFNWNKSRTAKTLGIERSTLDRKIKRYDLAQENARS